MPWLAAHEVCTGICEWSCWVSGPCRKDEPFPKHAKAWKGASRHAWQEEPAPNRMQLLFKAPFSIFTCVEWCKMCFFILLLKKTHRQWNTEQKDWSHAGKGVMGKEKARQQPKICHLLVMLDEMFGPAAALCVLSCFQPCLSSRKKESK